MVRNSLQQLQLKKNEQKNSMMAWNSGFLPGLGRRLGTRVVPGESRRSQVERWVSIETLGGAPRKQKASPIFSPILKP